jgi:hypothetical protein
MKPGSARVSRASPSRARRARKMRALPGYFLRRTTMNTLQKRVEVIEKIGAGAWADQTLRKLIHLHLQKYERQLEEVQKELEPFERQYGLSSDECHRRFMAGELGDAPDIVEWMGLYDNALLYRERIETLRSAAEA